MYKHIYLFQLRTKWALISNMRFEADHIIRVLNISNIQTSN